MRIATFNLENLDSKTVDARRIVLVPQLQRLRADIMLFQEVNDMQALESLLSDLKINYELQFTKDENDRPFKQRNVVIASSFEILETKQFKHEFTPAPEYKAVTGEYDSIISWERPALYSKIKIEKDTVLHVINLHLKSKNPVAIKGQKQDSFSWKTIPGWSEGFFIASIMRVGQALEVRTFVDRLLDDDPNANIIVGGDLNSDFDETPVEALLGKIENTNNPNLQYRELVPCEYSVPDTARFSLYHKGNKNMLDHLLMSQNMVQYYSHAQIHNETLKDESIAFATDDKFIGSDHAPVVGEFRSKNMSIALNLNSQRLLN